MSRSQPTPRILGASPLLRAALAAAERVAPTAANVVLHGESGTGKELFARHLHAHRGRRGVFIALNCAALPDALAESQLFGHRRGAFTGASEAQPGFLVSADGGTLFLDEVGELPTTVQAKLLRVLQERTVVAVGDTRERPVDLRVVAASHRDLRQLVAAGRFREDLFHRLARFELALPPLRERDRDAVLIARSLLAAGIDGLPPKRLARRAEAALLACPWPGNVRELSNVLFRAALLSSGRVVTEQGVAAALGAALGPVEASPEQRVLDAVREAGQVSSTELARVLSLAPSTAKRLLQAQVEEGALVRTGRARSTRYRLALPGSVALDERETIALDLVDRQGRVTRQELVVAASLAARTAGRVLSGLVERGLLVPDGRRGKSAGYQRPPAPDEAA